MFAVACSDHYGYRCDTGACVRTGTWCNGVVDCPDASDEKDVYCRQQGMWATAIAINPLNLAYCCHMHTAINCILCQTGLSRHL